MIKHQCTISDATEVVGIFVFLTRQREGFVKGEPLFLSNHEEFENDIYDHLDLIPFHWLVEEGEDPREYMSNYYHAIENYCNETGMTFEWNCKVNVYKPDLYDDITIDDAEEIVFS